MKHRKESGKAPSLAVIGCGHWGKNIVRNLYELGVLDTVCEKNADILSSVRAKYSAVKTNTDLGKVLSSGDIDAVAIATPATTHYAIAKEAILAGKDVFVEKPLATNIKEAEELATLSREKNKILMVGHILQYHPALIKLKDMLRSGELGKIQYIYSNRLNIGKLRVEENILWSFAPHDISAILMLLEEEPVKVTAFGGSYITEGIYDASLTTLEFKNKVRAHIFVSWLHPFKEQKLIVVGTKAMAVFDDVSKEKLIIYPHKIDYIAGKIPIAQKAEHYNVTIDDKEPLKEELKHFVECIKQRKEPRTGAEDGLRVLKVLEQAEAFLASSSKEKIDLNKENDYFVHESSCVDEDVKIGRGSQIWHFSHILSGSKVGRDCRIGQNVVIGPNVSIGDRVKIQNNVSVYKGVTLEEDVFCGPSVVFTNVFNPRSAIPRMKEIRSTLVKAGSSIGANATIICGHTIGRYAFIGAGAVVTKDIPDYGLFFGNPAVFKGWICECGSKLEFAGLKARCQECKRQYERNGDAVTERLKTSSK